VKPGRALAAFLVGLLLLAVGTALAASDRLKTRADTETIGALDSSETSATCDGQAKTVSGGFENEFDPDEVVGGNSPQPSQYTSRRSAKRSWAGGTFNIGSVAGDVTTFAYCRGEKLKGKSKSATIEGTPIGQSMSGDYNTGTATAKCPRGAKAVSGGFDNPDFDVPGSYEDQTRIVPYASRRQGGRKWGIEAANFGGAEGTLVAYVYCREDAALDVKKKSVTLSPPLDQVVADAATAKCPKGHRVVSGGFDVDEIDAPVLASKKRGGRKWQVRASAGYPNTVKLTAFAYCEEK
jgi:hypothetical protein